MLYDQFFIDDLKEYADLERVFRLAGENLVHHFLKNHDLVERFAFASSDQGGNGATVAEIKL